MATEPGRQQRVGEGEPSGWAEGGLLFAGSLLLIIGVCQAIVGLVAILENEFFVVRPNYVFEFDASGWGWIHLVLGLLIVLVAASLLTGRAWAAVTTVVIASLSAIANFFFIPYYPFWSLLVIALDIWVIWAVTRPGVLRRE
jgi:hypothetical protein